MNKILTTAFMLFTAMAAGAQNIIDGTLRHLSSPDGHYRLTFYQRGYGGGRTAMFYTLKYDGKTVITESELGVNIDNKLFESALGIPNDTCRWGDNLRFLSADSARVDTVWQPLYGEYTTIRNRYNALNIVLCKGEGSHETVAAGYNKRQFYYMNVEMRAYNEGVAVRYHFPEATNGLFLHITGERTSFTMPRNTEAWHESWAQGPFTVVTLGKWQGESERPLLLRRSDGLYMALGEARMVDYARGKFELRPVTPQNIADDTRTLCVSMYGCADIITPYDTPWRVVMVGNHATELINNKQIFLNLNDECKLKDTSFIRPGKAFRVGQLNRTAILKGIDFAAERGIQFIELDAGWYGPEASMASQATRVTPTRDFDMADICRRARDKGVGVWLYVNQRALYTQLDSLLPLYKKWGVAGIKFGFVQIGNQHWSTWLHNAVARCGEYGLMVDIHDEYRPTGVSRTYPNLLTQEGIGGNEEMPDAVHNTVLPFTRFLCGPADYTLCYFNKRVKNTKAHQLAMAVVYYSPLQFLYWYDRPEDYKGEAELKFWKDVPTVWDDSRALAGAPGKYIVQARRSGKDWYVGVLNNTEARTLELNTADFLPKGKRFDVELYTDDASLKTRTNVRLAVIKNIKPGKRLTLTMPASGGAALRFTER